MKEEETNGAPLCHIRKYARLTVFLYTRFDTFEVAESFTNCSIMNKRLPITKNDNSICSRSV